MPSTNRAPLAARRAIQPTLKRRASPAPDYARQRGAAPVRLSVWCKLVSTGVEPDPAEMAERYGAEMTVPEWRKRLVCSRCGSRHVDMVVSGTKGR